MSETSTPHIELHALVQKIALELCNTLEHKVILERPCTRCVKACQEMLEQTPVRPVH